MIYSTQPTDWRDLQKKVAEVFREIGFMTEVEKEIETARGTVDVDVYAEDTSQSPRLIYLCECKHWSKAVPQSVIHSFRTVVSDFGANYGLVISKKGFQKGSSRAAKFTNIQLLDWNQFQALFEDRWYDKFMAPKILEESSALVAYTEPFNGRVDKEVEKLDKDKQRTFVALQETYRMLAGLALMLSLDVLGHSPQKPDLPLEKALKLSREQNGQPFDAMDLLHVAALRDFLQILIRHCREGTEKFDRLFGKKIR